MMATDLEARARGREKGDSMVGRCSEAASPGAVAVLGCAVAVSLAGCVKKDCPGDKAVANAPGPAASMCGEGTIFADGKCRAESAAGPDPSMCGEGTVFKDGKCVIREAAEPETTAGGSRILAEFSDITDKMCDCHDKPCAEGVNKEFEDWLKRNEAAHGTRAEQERAKVIAERYTKCMMAAMAAAPDAAGGSPSP